MHFQAILVPSPLSPHPSPWLQVAQGLFPRHPLLFTYMILQVEDAPTTDLVRYFPKCFDFIDKAISKGGKHTNSKGHRLHPHAFHTPVLPPAWLL